MQRVISVLIKPSSSACNMHCEYCFYKDLSKNMHETVKCAMSEKTIYTIVEKALTEASDGCNFAFQGGEPTLRGLDFFKQFVDIQKKLNKKNLRIQNSIQTNGVLIDDEWAEFLAENQFLVGLSLDGPAEIHNNNRFLSNGTGSYNKIMQAVKLFNKHNVSYNILSVVTGKNARSIVKIYNFLKKNNFGYVQFIPCLEPLDAKHGKEAYHLSSKDYADFLITLFDMWSKDFLNDKYISIRYFDNLFHMLFGRPPESCSMNGICSVQHVIEGNGDVYPCDFYVVDKYKLGNICEMDFDEMSQSDIAQDFVKRSRLISQECKECPYFSLCRSGCMRDRVKQIDGSYKNYYCESYKKFFSSRAKQIRAVCDKLSKG